jgi:hypothetical protein
MTAGTATLGTSTTTLFSATGTNGGGVTAFQVAASTNNAELAYVNVPGLHLTGEWMPLEPGAAAPFRIAVNGIQTVYAKGSSTNTVTVYYGVSARL